MIKPGYKLWLLSGGHGLACAAPLEKMIPRPPARYDLGDFITPKVLLASPSGEDHTHVIRRELPEVSIIYPWSRIELTEVMDKKVPQTRMIGRDVTADFRRVMTEYYSSDSNPNHFFFSLDALVLIKMAF